MEGQEKTVFKIIFNIVFVILEVVLYFKIGGLGDVCGFLFLVLVGRGYRVMVVFFRYLYGIVVDKKYVGVFDVKCRIKVNCFGGV